MYIRVLALGLGLLLWFEWKLEVLELAWFFVLLIS